MGATYYARSPVTSTFHGVPSVADPSVISFFSLYVFNAFHQSAHAVGPCHSCGGNSSIIETGESHTANAFSKVSFPRLSKNRFTAATTSLLSSAKDDLELMNSANPKITIEPVNRLKLIASLPSK